MNIQLRVKGKREQTYIPIDHRRRGVIFLRPNHWTDHLPDQEQLCRNYCEKNNIEVVDTYKYLGDDVAELAVYRGWGISPILEYCDSHPGEIEVLIVDRRDRLGTNTEEYLKNKLDLLQRGVEILGASEIEPLDSSIGEICVVIEEYRKEK